MKRPLLPALVTTAALALTGPAAFADKVVVKDDVDAVMERMVLEYDSDPGVAGTPGVSKLRIVVEGKEVGTKEHPGCNLPGDHTLTVAPVYDERLLSVAFAGGDDTFDGCDDALEVVVTPRAVTAGTPLTFTGTVRSGDGEVKQGQQFAFDFAQAKLAVVVEEVDLAPGDDGSAEMCDRNPAAPAWANAILKANGVELKGKERRDVIRAVAREMGKAAGFPNRNGDLIAKSAGAAYRQAVYHFMTQLPGLDLDKGPQDAQRPPKACTTVS